MIFSTFSILLVLVFLFFFFVSAQGTSGGYGYIVELQTPENGSVEFDGNVAFSYIITNSSYTMDNCSFIFDGIINQTEINISSSSTNYFYLNNLQNDEYSWSVNCSWSDGNISQSEARVFDVFNDTTPPVVNIEGPSNGFNSTDRTLQLNYSVDDDGWIVNCSLYTNMSGTWAANQTNYFVIKNISQTFELNNVPNDLTFKWNIICYDFASSPNSAWSTVNRTIAVQNPLPVFSELSSQTWGEDSLKVVNLSEYSSDSDSDELTYNASSSDHISAEVDETSGIVTLTSETNWYGSEYITFYVYDSDNGVGDSEILLTVTEQGDTAPRYITLSPEDNYLDGDGYLFLTPNVTDDYVLTNISLYSNTGGSWQLEETVILTGATNFTTFVLANISEGNYTYSFLAYDNSSQGTWSENRTIAVGINVSLEHDISSYTVNHVDHNRTIVVSHSIYLNDVIELGNLSIYISNGSLYFNKDLSIEQGFEFNLTEPTLNVYVEKIRIRYEEIFYGDFTVGNDEWINITLDYNYLGEERQISTEHIMEVI
ncbi:MAG: hypothetical protein AABX23_04425 [Nanoarchaeota archaeon]